MSEDDRLRYDEDGQTEAFLNDLMAMTPLQLSCYEKYLQYNLAKSMGYNSYMLSLFILCSLIGRTHEQKRSLILDYNREKGRCIFRTEVVANTDSEDQEEINFTDDDEEDGDEWKNPKNQDNI